MDGQSSDLEDPFIDSSLFSIFPRTFNQFDLHPDRNSLPTDSLEAVRSLFDSMVLKNPNKLLEQAKGVLERFKVDNREVTRGEDALGEFGGVIQKNVENARDEDPVGDVRGVNHQNPQGRRPALGRKRARFSLKPNSSQSIECLEPDVDIDKFPDPEEFFSALEKHENAKNELRRHNGRALMDLDQNVPHIAERQRRPGLLRKSATYKHRFSMAPSGDFLSSQEALSQDLCSPTPSRHYVQTENTDKIPVPSPRELSGPMAAGRDGPADISDEEQFGQNKDEGDDIIGMLKERFKPIQINKSCLPDLDSVLQSEFKILGESLQDSQDKMSDLHGIVSAIGKETTLGSNNMERSSGHPSTSVTPPKSPYSSISLLKARLYQSRKENDPFSALDIDLSPIGKAASSKDPHDLSARDLENPVKNSKNKMPLQDSQDKMSDLHGIVSAIGKETTLGSNNMERSSGHPSTSVTPPKSPYSSISLLKARLYQSRKENDPFSALDIDLSPIGKAASSKDPHDLSARDLENPVKNSKNMPNVSPVTTMHIDSGHATGRSDSGHGTGHNDTMETNPNESECNVASKCTQNLAAAKFTSEKSSVRDSITPAVLSDFIDHMELDHDTVEHGGSDITPKSPPLHEKKSDANHTMETVKDGLKTLGAFSDGVSHIELDHAIRRSQSPKSAAYEKESNVVHSKDILDLDAENLAPSEETMKDNSTISGNALDTTPHGLSDQNINVDTTGRVLEDNPSEVFDAAAIASDQHIEPDGRADEEGVQGPSRNKEQSTSSAGKDLEKDRRSSDHCKLPTEGAVGDLDQDRPSSRQTRPLKKICKASSKTTTDTSRKAREPSREQPPAERIAKAARKQTRESKECSRRKSLAACGTRWETGIRRSTRIRTRPLEWWKGERQLYGRIHKSLITVVGTKYFSPTKEAGQAILKVNSYVSDEYMEIVERAALH